MGKFGGAAQQWLEAKGTLLGPTILLLDSEWAICCVRHAIAVMRGVCCSITRLMLRRGKLFLAPKLLIILRQKSLTDLWH